MNWVISGVVLWLQLWWLWLILGAWVWVHIGHFRRAAYFSSGLGLAIILGAQSNLPAHSLLWRAVYGQGNVVTISGASQALLDIAPLAAAMSVLVGFLTHFVFYLAWAPLVVSFGAVANWTVWTAKPANGSVSQ